MNPYPLVSCIMPTYNRRQFVPQAIKYFLRQDYEPKELIIVDDVTDAIGDLVPADDRIRYNRLDKKLTIGAKRNLACEQARGEIIVHWDDDDWHAPYRVSYQVENLLQKQADICGLDKVLFFEPSSNRAWEYVYQDSGRPWVYGATLCYTKAFWSRNRFPDINVGEDSRFVWGKASAKILKLTDSAILVAQIHPGNTSPKQTVNNCWHVYFAEKIRGIMNEDSALYTNTLSVKKREGLAKDSPTALITAAFGIGDILRITPLIRVFSLIGYQVDVLVAPDYPDTAMLLEGAPEIRRLYNYRNFRSNKGQIPLTDLDKVSYDIATFTVWSLPMQRWIKAKQTFVFPQSQWLQEGDIACVKKIADGVGWDGPLPEPFAVSSQSQFNLPPNTIALHPGCKLDWPWKKWHGFEELSRLIPEVVLIGTESDLDNTNTYFRRTFTWPGNVRNFVGTLDLRDTAALLRQCAALISNDSGMMQLGVAMGISTFGIFGITSPHREIMPTRNMFPITKGLPCEAECRKVQWGRKDCENHLECLRSLTAEEVLDQVKKHLNGHSVVPAQELKYQEVKTMEELGLIYYGYVFDASGYGHAARAYIHALHNAGVNLSIVDLANHPRQVRDELVESLIGRKVSADFHLFHGIPNQWARLAFSLPNAIGMTVWETDSMPTQWQNILSHVLEVWLPCEFNVSTFKNSLDTSIFKLPHPLLPVNCNGGSPEPNQFLGITEQDFVFYSIFEWQDRKSPQGLIEAYLRAFSGESDTVLIIKANPGAKEPANHVVENARSQLKSKARIEVRCEAWNDGQIKALHERGDCYVSLHRGEGWCYPLFEAASQGTPVIATAYSGPLDYLNPQEHCLIQFSVGPVRQPYQFYHPRMRWAEPDINQAVQYMRWVYENQESAKERAATAAERIRNDYSLESIGLIARNRLLTLLKRTRPDKWKTIQNKRLINEIKPTVPIPGEWYDEGYFETGLKSNWDKGYIWPSFEGLFRETAKFLSSIFSEAASYLDIGCAKGFLVRALREQGKDCWGFDHSQWAIDQTEESIKPFIIQAGVDNVKYDREFDVLLALSIFESLTESQVFSFLSRVRIWARQAIFATIPSFETEQEERFLRAHDQDLSHIMIRSRQWWHDLFLRAGWRQDHVHRIAQRVCQTHDLPTKLGWKVYVYAP